MSFSLSNAPTTRQTAAGLFPIPTSAAFFLRLLESHFHRKLICEYARNAD